jgi:hypothetical protein
MLAKTHWLMDGLPNSVLRPTTQESRPSCADQHDRALLLARQATFRDQYRRLRSPDLIRGDVALALGMAGDHTVVLAMLRLLLALVEVNERTSNLESVDMLGLLCDAGLID